MHTSRSHGAVRVGAQVTMLVAFAFACQSIAGVEDVEYAGNAGNAGRTSGAGGGTGHNHGGDSSTEGGMTGSDGGVPGAGGGASALCETYCTTVLANCEGPAFAVYEDFDTCMGACASLDSESTSETGNTVKCRLRQAELAPGISAVNEKQVHCAAAGPGGSDVCRGSQTSRANCEGYCQIFMDACPDINDWSFTDFDGCVKDCAAVPRAPEGGLVDPESFGDNLACRLYHASAATLDPGGARCDSAGIAAKGDCRGSGEPSCIDYCQIVGAACEGDQYAPYESVTQCRAVCDVMLKGLREDSSGDTVGCRVTHAYFALKDPITHCNHVGPVGDQGCKTTDNSNCVSFCSYAREACPTQYLENFTNDADCASRCIDLPDSAPGTISYRAASAEQSGNTLQCRLLHAARALTRNASQRTEAVCAPIFGGAPCQ